MPEQISLKPFENANAATDQATAEAASLAAAANTMQANNPNPTGVAPTPPAEPAFVIPEKFVGKSVEDVIKSYQELEKMKAQTAPTPATPAAVTPEVPKPTLPGQPKPAAPVATEEAVKESAEVVKQVLTRDDFTKFSTEFLDKGELSTESFKELETKYSIGKDMAELHLSMAKQAQELRVMKIEQNFGGKEQWETVRDWASENLSDGELSMVADMANSDDWTKIESAINFMKFKHGEAGSPAVNLVAGKGQAGDGGVQPFRSLREQLTAQKDPRYGKDMAYTELVQKQAFAGANLY